MEEGPSKILAGLEEWVLNWTPEMNLRITLNNWSFRGQATSAHIRKAENHELPTGTVEFKDITMTVLEGSGSHHYCSYLFTSWSWCQDIKSWVHPSPQYNCLSTPAKLMGARMLLQKNPRSSRLLASNNRQSSRKMILKALLSSKAHESTSSLWNLIYIQKHDCRRVSER